MKRKILSILCLTVTIAAGALCGCNSASAQSRHDSEQQHVEQRDTTQNPEFPDERPDGECPDGEHPGDKCPDGECPDDDCPDKDHTMPHPDRPDHGRMPRNGRRRPPAPMPAPQPKH